jgi:N-acetylglucosaminyldiphosphoundecaprenol N-acetyl-beta-D-mannosaminyltransferase
MFTHKQSKKADNTEQIMGVGVASTSIAIVLEKIDQICNISFKKPYFITTINPEILMIARQDPDYKSILNSADISVPDGNGLKLVKPDMTIIPGRKLVEHLVTSKKYRIFYLGGAPGVALAMATKYGGLGDSGEKDIKNPQDNKRIITKINNFKPDILLVAYGAPYQEKWLNANSKALRTKVMMGVGGSFDYLTGKAALPPQLIEKLGFEWLWRLTREPKRWKRQLILIKFALLTFF